MMKFLTNRGFPELLFRARQFLWNTKDRLLFDLGNDLHDAHKKKEESSQGIFFFDSNVHENTISRYCEISFEYRDGIIEEADKICKHQFDLLGYKNLRFGNETSINWHLDSVREKKPSLDWWQKVNYMDASAVGDSKVIWELSRHQYLVRLGKAFVLSGNDKYRKEFISQLNSWFDANPPKRGINWCSSLELSFRSIAWIWAYHLFGGATNLPQDFLGKFLSFLNIQAEHIEHNLSTYYSPNTHLTGEALGLFYIGTVFQGLKGAERWLEKGIDILLQCIDEHVLPDGGYMERSLWYHRYTIDFYIHFYLLARFNNVPLPSKVEDKILQLAEFLMYTASPDRHFPLIGDDDGGRLLPIDNLEGNDLKGLFSTLSVIFNRGDFKYLSGGYQEETLWLLGPDSKVVYDSIEEYKPTLTSKGFEETGYFFMRESWSEKANYLAFNCGPHGWMNCGHAHADTLSFQITSGEQPVIVDPGTYTYASEDRDYFRGADCHSTIKVDGFYPAVTNGPFRWKVTPQHKLVKWHIDSKYDYVSGCMIGGVDWKHAREVFFIKPDIFFIVDTINGTGRHELEIRFPLYGKEWEIRDNKCMLKSNIKSCSIESVGKVNLDYQLIDSWVSLCYGHKMPSYTLVFKGMVELSCKVGFLINLSDCDYKIKMLDEREGTFFKILLRENSSEIFEFNSTN